MPIFFVEKIEKLSFSDFFNKKFQCTYLVINSLTLNKLTLNELVELRCFEQLGPAACKVILK